MTPAGGGPPRLDRTDVGTWAWWEGDDVVPGTNHTNPKLAVVEGLELLRDRVASGVLDLDDARSILKAAGERLAAVEDPGDAHEEAQALLARSVDLLDR